eukprot:4554721-Pleurochrysis_carterae.AAC.1
MRVCTPVCVFALTLSTARRNGHEYLLLQNGERARKVERINERRGRKERRADASLRRRTHNH